MGILEATADGRGRRRGVVAYSRWTRVSQFSHECRDVDHRVNNNGIIRKVYECVPPTYVTVFSDKIGFAPKCLNLHSWRYVADYCKPRFTCDRHGYDGCEGVKCSRYAAHCFVGSMPKCQISEELKFGDSAKNHPSAMSAIPQHCVFCWSMELPVSR